MRTTLAEAVDLVKIWENWIRHWVISFGLRNRLGSFLSLTALDICTAFRLNETLKLVLLHDLSKSCLVGHILGLLLVFDLLDKSVQEPASAAALEKLLLCRWLQELGAHLEKLYERVHVVVVVSRQ